MRKDLEDIQNQNHIIREQIYSLSERFIRTAHSHSIDDVISPNMRRKIEDIIGEYLLEMSIKAQSQLLYLPKEYERQSHQFSAIRKILQRWSKEKHKPEKNPITEQR